MRPDLRHHVSTVPEPTVALRGTGRANTALLPPRPADHVRWLYGDHTYEASDTGGDIRSEPTQTGSNTAESNMAGYQ